MIIEELFSFFIFRKGRRLQTLKIHRGMDNLLLQSTEMEDIPYLGEIPDLVDPTNESLQMYIRRIALTDRVLARRISEIGEINFLSVFKDPGGKEEEGF